MVEKLSMRTNVTLALAVVIVLLAGVSAYTAHGRDVEINGRLERIEKRLDAMAEAIRIGNVDAWKRHQGALEGP